MGKKTVRNNIVADTILILNSRDIEIDKQEVITNSSLLFTDITSSSGISYRHTDYEFNDFAIQRLLPQKFSQLGPFLTAGDINKDGKIDFYIGAAATFSGVFFLQNSNHTFSPKNLLEGSKFEEDSDCLLFDEDNDGDLDLIVTYGDVQQPDTSSFYRPRLYINDGKGNFSFKDHAIPDNVRTIAGCVSAGDYDHDGDLDLFIGGRVSKQYPISPRSFILQNDQGVFSDVTEKACASLQRPGMVTSSVWLDFDNDGQLDLIVAGEWMPVRFFRNNHGNFKEVTTGAGMQQMNGMWRSLEAADIDNDGDLDLIAGNLGLNCRFQVTASEPMQLIAMDMDNNGSIDPILFYYIKDKHGEKRLFPDINRSQFADQVPSVKKKFLLNKDYANASFNDIFRGKADFMKFSCDETRSCYFENLGNGSFVKHVLPMEAQFAPINAIVCDDFDKDGFKDLLLAGNEYQTEVVGGRYDASYGCFLKGNGKKEFIPVSPAKCGFILKGDVKDMQLLKLSNGNKMILCAINNDSLRVFRANK
jgi:hypothetical protein